MNDQQENNPLHGVTLKKILQDLVVKVGWEEMTKQVEIRCFMFDPTISSSLKFLRKTPWARAKVEQMWIDLQKP